MMREILVIGAGFSGAAIAVRLIRQAGTTATRVHLVNGSGRIARGMAYGTQSPDHVLNVPAGNMSAFDEDPDDFLRFARRSAPDVMPGSFVSRRLYGDYLEWLLDEAERMAPAHVELRRIDRKVMRIDPAEDGAASLVTLDSGDTVWAEKVVLALGHFPASRLPLDDTTFYQSQHYLHDPWEQRRLDAIPARAPVLLLGTGLTAVDVSMTLLGRNPERPITAVSRRGLLPQPHRHAAAKPGGTGAASIWGDADTVRSQLRGFRRYCRAQAAQDRDWREGLALLRPVTADIWMAYPDRERKRFLRHVQPYWDTHRHRMAPMVAERFHAALNAGVVGIVAGRITGLRQEGEWAHVSVRPRGSDELRVHRAQYVINCTGPCANPRQAASELVQQLLRDGLMRTDTLGLGIDVAADCAVVAANGQPSRSLFYIGPWLKARYWEATAVPDLRGVAGRLASRIMREG